MTFPVSCVNCLGEFPEAGKGCWLVMMDHIVLDVFHESIISLTLECGFTPVDPGSKLHELDEVFCCLVVFLHTKSFQFSFCFTNRIVGSEVVFKFLNKKCKIQEPCGLDGIQEHGFKAIQCG